MHVLRTYCILLGTLLDSRAIEVNISGPEIGELTEEVVMDLTGKVISSYHAKFRNRSI